jgi:Flp pilus assembly protein TadD
VDPPKPSRREWWLAAAALALAVAVSYGIALDGGFVWDDAPLIVDNSRVKVAGEYAHLLFSSFWETGDGHDRFRAFFRPLVSASYAVDYAVWGLRPFGFHLTNVLLHFLCCVLVWRIARDYRLGPAYALLGALAFAAHPVHVESVAWISGRTDLMCALGVLAAFLAYRRGAAPGGRRSYRVASWVLFLFALFCKEMAATLPLLVLCDRWRAGSSPKAALRATVPFWIVFAVYWVARIRVLGDPAAPVYELGPAAWLATALFAAARYLTLLILPVGLDAHYPYRPLDSPATPLALVALVMLATTAAGTWLLWRRSRTAVFWVAWIFVGLAPVMTFGRFGDVILADRFLYLPSVGFCVLVAMAARFAIEPVRARRAWIAALAAVALVCPLAVASRERSRVWKDDATLFADMLETSPDSALVRNNYGLALYHGGQVDAAIEEFTTAVALTPGYAMAHNNLGAALERRERLREAMWHYRRAVELAPGSMQPERNLAHLLVRTGSVEEGARRLDRLLERYPSSPDVLYAVADTRYRAGDTSAATRYLLEALAIHELHAESHYLLGKIRYEQGRRVEAARSMTRFLDLWPEREGPVPEAARRIVAEAAREDG